jgi:hypothetical protein
LASQGGDGDASLEAAPPNQDPTGSKWTGGQGISIQEDPACVSCQLELACPFFASVRQQFSKDYPGFTGCAAAPPAETPCRHYGRSVSSRRPLPSATKLMRRFPKARITPANSSSSSPPRPAQTGVLTWYVTCFEGQGAMTDNESQVTVRFPVTKVIPLPAKNASQGCSANADATLNNGGSVTVRLETNGKVDPLF